MTTDNIQATAAQIAEMQHRLSGNYMAYRVHIKFPARPQATLNAKLLPSDIREKFKDRKISLGKMDVMPEWFKNAGGRISSRSYNGLKDLASNGDPRFGWMVRADKAMTAESLLLGMRGIKDEDRVIYDGTDVVERAEELILTNRAKLKPDLVAKNCPVTYYEYIDYYIEHRDALKDELMESYKKLFGNDQDLLDIIEASIPMAAAFENQDKIEFSWNTRQEVPACISLGETNLQNIIRTSQSEERAQAAEKAMRERVAAKGEELIKDRDAIMKRELEDWRKTALDSVASIQLGVRKTIAERLELLKNKLVQEPMTVEERNAVRESTGQQRVVDPAAVSTASVKKLVATLQDLGEELGQFNSADGFKARVDAIIETLGVTEDWSDLDIRQQTSDSIQEIIDASLEEEDINPENGEFFAGLF